MKVNFHLDKKNKPQSENGVRVVYGQAKRGGYRFRWYLILAIVLSPLLFMGHYLYRTQVLVTAPAIVTSHPVTINVTHAGVVGLVPAKVGQMVNSGQSLILLTDPVLDREIEFINQELAELPLESASSIDVLYTNAIRRSQSSVAKVNDIQRKYANYRAKGQVSEVDYASIVNIQSVMDSQLSNQKIAYEQAQRDELETKLAGAVANERRALMKELVVKRALQESLSILAPFEGRVLEIHALEGERVSLNRPLVTISKNITPEIIAFLDPKYLEYSKIGTVAKVKYPDGKTYRAKVSSPVEVVNKLPSELQSPFEGQPAFLKVNLKFDQALEPVRWIEGVDVEVQF